MTIGKQSKFLTIDDTKQVEMTAVVQGGAGSEDAIVRTGSDGLIAPSLLPSGGSIVAVSNEVIALSDTLNLFWDVGNSQFRCQKADAANNKACDGVAKTSAAGAGENVTVQVGPSIILKTGHGMTAGLPAFLSATPGGWTTTPPSTSGHLWQRVGKIKDANNIFYERAEPITRA